MGYGGLFNKIIDPFGIGDPEDVQPADPGAVGSDFTSLLNAYIRSQPDVLQAEQTYKPQYLGGSIANLQTAVPAAQGLFNQSNTATRQANVGDAMNLGGGAAGAVRNVWDTANPNSGALLNKLTDQANAGLAAGTRMTSDETRNILNPIQSHYASAGFAPGALQGLDEGVNLFAGGQNLLNQRQNFASGVYDRNASVNNALLGPSMNLVSGESQAPAFGQVIASGAGPSIINPNSAYDIFNTAYNARSAANIATGNNQAAANSY